MNREIKFRAYGNVTNQMHYFDLMEYTIMNEVGQEEVLPTTQSFSLMQYTGLKDKNGKEIYERDIVKIHSDIYDDNLEVHFSCGGFMAGDAFLDDYWNMYGHMFEVIGNKFENPELLEVK